MEKTIAVATAVLLSLTGLAELARLPVRDAEDVLDYTLANTDLLEIIVTVEDHPELYRQWWSIWYVTFADGRKALAFESQSYEGKVEKINALARRSRGEFETFVSNVLRAAVNSAVNTNNLSLAGKKVGVSTILSKDVRGLLPYPSIGWTEHTYWHKELPPVLTEEGRCVQIPEDLFEVNLLYRVYSWVFAPVLRGRIIYDFWGGFEIPCGVDTVYDTVGLGVPIWEPELRHGKIELFFRGGTKQVFDLADGRLLETIRPQMVPVSVSLTAEGVEVSADSAKTVIIDRAPTLPPRWEETPQGAKALRRSSTGTTYSFPTAGKSGFFQARVAPE